MTTITDTGKYPIYTMPGNPFNPYTKVTITPDYTGQRLTATVNLSSLSYPPQLGTISDPSIVSPTTNLAETIVAADLSDATTLAQRLIYTPPNLASGQASSVSAPLTFFPTFYDGFPAATDTAPVINTVTSPSITGTIANQPVAAAGTIKPFATTQIIDADFGYTAQDTAKITFSYNGVPLDVQFAGPGLSQTGVGTYTLGPTPYYNITNELRNLTLTVPSFFGIKTPQIELDVTDVPPVGAVAAPGFDPTTALTTKDTITSVRENGTPITTTIAGKAQEGQILTSSSNDPAPTFQWQRSVDGVTWNNIANATSNMYVASEADENDVLRVQATDLEQTNSSSATAKVVDVTPTLTVSVSGTPQVDQTLLATPNLVTDADGNANSITYQWQRSVDVNGPWDNITGATANSYKLAVADNNNFVRLEASFADDTNQSISVDSISARVGGNGVNHFHIVDTTTGATTDSPGDAYNGPVAGIDGIMSQPPLKTRGAPASEFLDSVDGTRSGNRGLAGEAGRDRAGHR